MARIIPGEGPCPLPPPRLMIVGERPGKEEWLEGSPFVGPAGDELWGRVRRILKLERDQVYVTNLVKTFSVRPPTAEEIAVWGPRLRLEVVRCRPAVIMTVGYHAARFFLPQFRGVIGDYFHGLAFPVTYGRLSPRTAVCVPVVHSSAALRQPDRYQSQLTEDLEGVRSVLAGQRSPHVARRPLMPRSGLCHFGGTGVLGLDTEGTVAVPEAITIAKDAKTAYIEEIEIKKGKARPPSKFLRKAILGATRIALHAAVGDMKVMQALGVSLERVDDTMLMAYLLQLPQSLKVLAYRELGWEMHEYQDLVRPIDEARVRHTLSAAHLGWVAHHADLQRQAERIAGKAAKKAGKAKGRPVRVTKKAVAGHYKALLARKDAPPAMRIVKALARMLATADTSTEDQALDDAS